MSDQPWRTNARGRAGVTSRGVIRATEHSRPSLKVKTWSIKMWYLPGMAGSIVALTVDFVVKACSGSTYWVNSFYSCSFVLFCFVRYSLVFFQMFGSRYCSLILFSEKCVPAKFVFSFWVPRILSSMNTKWRSVLSITASDDAAPTERE